MIKRPIPALIAVAAGGALLAGCTADAPQSEAPADYPTEDITLIVPYAAGSGPDSTVRVIASELESDLGVSVTIQNVEGGSSTIGLNQLAGEAADGYTIGYVGATGVTIQPRIIDTPFEGLSALEPIAQVTETPNVIVANPALGIETIEEFIEAAKDRPGELTVGIGDPASGQDLHVAILEQEAGIDLKPVYFGAGKNVLPAVNGTVDFSASQTGPVVQYAEEGTLNYIGVLSPQVPVGLDIPTFADAGYDLTGWNGWEGFFAPAGTPEEAIAVLSDAIGRAIESDAFQEYISGVYGIPHFTPYDEFVGVTEETDRNSEALVEQLGLAEQ